MPDAVYRDLVSTLFTMTVPIIGFGLLYVLVGVLIYLRWPDGIVGALILGAIMVTVARVLLIKAHHKAGGAMQDLPALQAWERRYAALTYVFALLLAALNVRVLMVHQPLMHIGTISLIFTFGAGIVSRNAGRPRLCVISLMLAVGPTVMAMLIHATTESAESLHAEFFVLEAVLILAVTVMSLGSVRHLHASSVEHLTAKHDLAKLARYDPLTGLPNRLLLREAFQARLGESLQGSDKLAIHYLDLDGFKAVNDCHGHPAGDRLLLEAAQRLTSMVRAQDVAARLGGDEFLLVQSRIQHSDQAEMLARRVIRQLSEPYVIDGVDMRVTVSIGIAMAPDYGTDLERLIACADAALYRSKVRGKAQVHFCAPDDYQEAGRAVA
ncbi:diguanylate cyclase domain-containing protein [Sphingobium sp.]|uniref:diguanylate cyclase domain-containing protein n=1 Tax=Sphingobium sp. TaxID=1912891 RepID=UPI0035C6B3D6